MITRIWDNQRTLLQIQLTIYNKTNSITMLKNSTEKYKKLYGTTSNQSTSNLAVVKFKQNSNKLNQIYSEISQPNNISKLAKAKKIQTSACFRHRTSNSNFSLQSLKGELEELHTNNRKFSFYSEKINPEKLTKTCRSSKLYQQSSEQQEQELPSRNSQEFINNIPRNSLFYCTHCYQYVFDIQKKRHFPQCKDKIQQPSIQSSAQVDFAYEKLTKIVQLAKYTSMESKNIQQFFLSIAGGEPNSIQKIKYPNEYQFFKLEEIEWALAYTYDSLLRGRMLKSNIFGCF